MFSMAGEPWGSRVAGVKDHIDKQNEKKKKTFYRQTNKFAK